MDGAVQKKTESMRVWVDEDLRDALVRLARIDHRTLSDYIGVVLSRHVYGHGEPCARRLEGTESAD